jgi:hypothetical protein
MGLKWSVPPTGKTNGFQAAGWVKARKLFLNSGAVRSAATLGEAELQPAAASTSAASAADRSGTDRSFIP